MTLDKKWPVGFLLESLVFPWLSARALKKYFNNDNITEISLNELIDFIIPKHKMPKTSYWIVAPAYKQKGIGVKTYKELVKHLSQQYLGQEFNTEWQKRVKKLQRHIEQREKINNA